MWSSKMAARWRGKDGDLNAGNSDFLVRNTPTELVLSRHDVEGVEMDTQSCMDHSILAIFHTSEDKSQVEEESETLLSALTEMLDSVEDDDGTLSPFDTLPDTQLLSQLERNDGSAELSLAERLRPRSKSPNVTLTVKSDGEKEDESKRVKNSSPQVFKQQSLFHSKNKNAEAEVEVFTSSSLVNLVKLMHPYCLKLHVEEDSDKVRNNHPLFSQEEVWKYERPSEESDEEINVVSDDEATLKDTKEGDEKRNNDNLLKSALLNGNSSRTASREKKRVSFGPIQVVSFDESTEKGLNEKNLRSGHTSETVSAPQNSTQAPENPAGSALDPKTLSSEMSSKKVEDLPQGETKAKSLSLQQYRQLRQKRRPLVEKQGNYTTKWPCVSEPPKELTPILCLQGQRPKAAHPVPDGRRSGADKLHRSQNPSHISAPLRPNPSEDRPTTSPRRSGLIRSRTESKIISPASPLSDVTANPNVSVPESKKSPVKKPAQLSTDPPNPVLLPLQVSQTTSPTTDRSSPESRVEFLSRDLDSTRHFPAILNETSDTPLQKQACFSGPKPEGVLVPQGFSTLFQEIKNKLSEIASGVSSRPPALWPATAQITTSSECKTLQTQSYSTNQVKEAKLEPKPPQSPGPDTLGQQKCPSLPLSLSQQPGVIDAHIPVKETLSEVQPSASPSKEPASTLQLDCRAQSATVDSGIEAPDLTSLLEQFEETQAKEERVCENEPVPKPPSSLSSLPSHGHMDVERTSLAGTERASEALVPLSTSESPGKPKILDPQTSEGTDIPEPLGTEIVLSTQQDQPTKRRNLSTKAIQIIEPRPLPSKKTHSNLPELPDAHTAALILSSVCSDHDYCGPVDRSLSGATQHSRASKLRDVSKNSDDLQVTTHESPGQTSSSELNATIRAVDNSPKTSPETSPSSDHALLDSAATEQHFCAAAADRTAPCSLPTPPPSPPARGREKRRYRRRSPRSDSSCSSCSSSSSSSSSSSASPSPKRQKHHHKRSESSSCSSSRSVSRSPPRRYRWSYSRSRCSRSRSRSWSHSRSPSRSRSPSPVCRRQWSKVYSSRESRKLRREHEIRIQKLKAINERRVVYVGRIRKSMTHDELRERFSQFGDVECVSLHFRDRGDHYAFVTFYNMDDAFAAIDNGGKLRRPDELPFDICFGGRRQFCSSDYADLDANRDAEPAPAKSKFEDLDFDSLLKQAQKGLKR